MVLFSKTKNIYIISLQGGKFLYVSSYECRRREIPLTLCYKVVTHTLIYAVVIHSLGIKMKKDCAIFTDSMKLNAHL